jgi:hypothetical protein
MASFNTKARMIDLSQNDVAEDHWARSALMHITSSQKLGSNKMEVSKNGDVAIFRVNGKTFVDNSMSNTILSVKHSLWGIPSNPPMITELN